MKIVKFSFAFGRNTLLLMALLFTGNLFSQTLIMNEVSNGPSGNKEYVEFVVTDTAAAYNCGLSSPPCIDIRGWIFDDNSGYHGSAGIAAGAVRFSNNALWSCVPLGTIILIYNDADPNAAVPANDLSTSDGNCRIIAPISSTLFETNATTPGAVACSYPATGWTPGGNWANTLLANPGDCARIVNLSGCEVFSVCWGTDNLNTLIYFGSAGGDHVFYFNNGDPTDQANWSEGCTDPSACGADEQTPGSANNAANAAFIAQFNNGCSPITPIASSIVSFTDASCGCNGTASVSASGSIPGYTYEWYDAAFVSIGQTTATATGLCAGTYQVISTSSIGCPDTATVTIGSTGTGITVNVSAAPSSTICTGSSVSLTATGATTYSWTPATSLSATTGSSVTANPGSTITYTVTGTTGACTGTANITITVNPLPIINIPTVPAVCETAPPFVVSASPAGGTWTGPIILADGTVNPSGHGGVSFVPWYTVTDANGCTDSLSTVISVDDNPTIIITPVSDVCAGTPAFNLSVIVTPTPGSWSGTGITSTSAGTFDPSVAGVGTHTITYTATNGACTNAESININVITGAVVSIDPAGPVCENQAAFSLTASPGGGTWSGPGTSTGGVFNPASAGDGIHTIVYTVPGSGGCAGSDTLLLQVDNLPTININPVAPLCTNSPIENFLATPGGGSWSGTGITSSVAGTFDPAVAGVGTHTVTYTVVNGTCTASNSVNVTVVAGTSISISALGPLVFCQGGSVQLTVSGAGTLPVTWSNGMSGNTITVTSSGNYFAMVNSGCGNDTSNTLSVTVNTIDAAFVPDPASGQAPLEVNLVDNTVNSATYYWSVGDSTYAINTDTVITFDTTGYFDITLYVVSPEGCIDSLTQTVYVYGEFFLVIPNIFTPNGDHANDVFSLQLAGVKQLEIQVFNRWGQQMHSYENSSVTDGTLVVWDGKVQSGDLASDGVYAFVLKAQAFTGAEQTHTGFITLIKSGK